MNHLFDSQEKCKSGLVEKFFDNFILSTLCTVGLLLFLQIQTIHAALHKILLKNLI